MVDQYAGTEYFDLNKNTDADFNDLTSCDDKVIDVLCDRVYDDMGFTDFTQFKSFKDFRKNFTRIEFNMLNDEQAKKVIKLVLMIILSLRKKYNVITRLLIYFVIL